MTFCPKLEFERSEQATKPIRGHFHKNNTNTVPSSLVSIFTLMLGDEFNIIQGPPSREGFATMTSTLTRSQVPAHLAPMINPSTDIDDIYHGNGKSMSAHCNARKQFLGNLNNYVPLGSMYAVAQDGHFSYSLWQELPDGLLGLDQSTKGIQELRCLRVNSWVRILGKRCADGGHGFTLRIYLLSDDIGRRWVDRLGPTSHTCRRSLKYLMEEMVDFSAKSWNGDSTESRVRSLEQCFTDLDRDDSLFYIFNTISSPSPDETSINCRFSSDVMTNILDSDYVGGLKTPLYPYQRRSAATMIRREAEPAKSLDPRLEAFKGPKGNTLYYDKETMALLKDERTYEEARGGILAETMGLGKTLICLAVILATKGHWPRIPPEFSMNLHPTRANVGSLMEMTAAAVARHHVPWRAHFQDLAGAGQDHEKCVSILEKNVASYVIVPPSKNHTRRPSTVLKEHKIRLCPVTLVVVPFNLLHHWQNEMALHLNNGSLNVIFVKTFESPMPPEDKIIASDVILIAKPRFEREMKPTDPSYESPLKNLHFLRIIVDEGHDFGSSGAGSNAIWALHRLHVERRWIISGTPTTGLLGVEVGLAAKETPDGVAVSATAANATLIKDRTGDTQEQAQERKDLERLGRIVTDFLQLKPWANSKGDDPASWQKYIMPRKDGSRKLRSLRSILEGLVVRHRIEDVEKDVRLPPLYNRILTVAPTWHDKLSLNLFILSLCVNAISSQRIDQDYMFDRRNRGPLSILVNNLRQAGFYWTGHNPLEIAKTVKFAQEYLEKQNDSLGLIGDNDKELLIQASNIGRAALSSNTWKNLSELNELGTYVENFPPDARKEWSLVKTDDHSNLSLITATHLAEAQTFVDSHLYAPDPAKGLAEDGKQVLESSWDHALQRTSGKPTSAGLADELKLLNKNTISGSKKSASPRRKKQSKSNPATNPETLTAKQPSAVIKSAMKTSSKHQPEALIPANSQLAQTTVCGFASAKLTYLLNQVITFHQTEKIIIFYEGNHIAYYIAQALELIDIRYLIYTGTLPQRRKAAYITTFNATDKFPVMLMDLSQAAHGLHLASASRIWFVNPVWQPKIEAQAIKRAHRIGQTKPVYVETIVLKDTLEDKMLWRRKTMSDEEHLRAEKSLLDDDIMKQIIQNATFIPMPMEQNEDIRPYARLSHSQQLFGRVGAGSRVPGDPDADLIFPGEMGTSINRVDQQQTHAAEDIQGVAVPPLLHKRQDHNSGNLVHRSNTKKKKGVSFGNTEANPSPSTSRQSSKRPAPASSPPPRKRVVGFAVDTGSEHNEEDATGQRSLFGMGSRLEVRSSED